MGGDHQDGNVVFSPASIAIALAMARAGAAGDTGTQVDDVLHLAQADGLHDAMGSLDAQLATRNATVTDGAGREQTVALRIANTQFVQDGMVLEPGFLATLARSYGAGVQLVDYAGQTEQARRIINAWVSDRTEQRIPELLATLDAATRLTLVNAVYLKAPWLEPMDRIGDATFTRLDGAVVSTPFMALSHVRSGRGEGWRSAALDYMDGELELLLVVPDAGTFAAFEAGVDAATLAAITAAPMPDTVDLKMPLFKIETTTGLGDALQALGMPLAFDSAADFTAMSAEKPLSIGEVIHQANIDVDENGTEAAAATAITMAGAGTVPGPPEQLVIDRPFLFLLRDRPTGTVLFMGRVLDPTTP